MYIHEFDAPILTPILNGEVLTISHLAYSVTTPHNMCSRVKLHLSLKKKNRDSCCLILHKTADGIQCRSKYIRNTQTRVVFQVPLFHKGFPQKVMSMYACVLLFYLFTDTPRKSDSATAIWRSEGRRRLLVSACAMVHTASYARPA